VDTTKDIIGTALGRIPSGCAILTVAHREQRTGMLVSWVQQAAFEPPCVTVCVRDGRPALRLIEGAGQFLLNVMGEDPTALFKHFGKGFSLEEDAFAGLTTEDTEFGPKLLGCIAHLACKTRDAVQAGDHRVYVAEVVAAEADASTKPYVHTRKSGMNY